jgi:hypothetical protein
VWCAAETVQAPCCRLEAAGVACGPLLWPASSWNRFASMQSAAAAAAAAQSAARHSHLVGSTKVSCQVCRHAELSCQRLREQQPWQQQLDELGKPILGLRSCTHQLHTLLHAYTLTICWGLEQQLQLTVMAVYEAERRWTSPSRGVPAGSNHRRHHVPQKPKVLC